MRATPSRRIVPQRIWVVSSGGEEVPGQAASVVLADLVRHTPGEEGKWFAAAKDAKLFDEAIALAKRRRAIPRR